MLGKRNTNGFVPTTGLIEHSINLGRTRNPPKWCRLVGSKAIFRILQTSVAATGAATGAVEHEVYSDQHCLNMSVTLPSRREQIHQGLPPVKLAAFLVQEGDPFLENGVGGIQQCRILRCGFYATRPGQLDIDIRQVTMGGS